MTAALGSRAAFPHLQARSYLNHASVAPASAAVQQAVAARLSDYARQGAGAIHEAIEERARLRERLATLLGCRAEDVALTGSTTRGIIDLSSCLGLRYGERILCFEKEFPANVTPWVQAARATGALVERLPQEGLDDDAVLSEVEAALQRGGVRLVAVSAVQFSTGRKMPLQQLVPLAHAHGAEVCVDAIQALGVVPLDVTALGVDYLAGGAHKWLMGLEGLGFVYAAPGRAERLQPRTAGWLSHVEPFAFLVEGPGKLTYDRPIREGIDFLEGHTLNVLGCAALLASLELILQLGVDDIAAHLQTFLDRLEQGLVERGFSSLRTGGSGILSVLPPEGRGAVQWAEALGAQGIAASAPDGKLRLSPHWPNALDEVELVLEAVDAVR